MELALQPFNEACWVAIFNALDALCYLCTVSTLKQRRILFERCIKCNALDTLMKVWFSVALYARICTHMHALQMIREHNYNLHKYIAVRVLRSLTSDLFLPEVLSPETAAELVELLALWTRDDETRWMEQMRQPVETWQIAIMTNRLTVCPLQSSCSPLLVLLSHVA